MFIKSRIMVITQVIKANFDAAVDKADRGSDALSLLQEHDYSLVMVNPGRRSCPGITSMKTESPDR